MQIIDDIKYSLNITKEKSEQLLRFEKLFCKFPENIKYKIKTINANDFLFKEDANANKVCVILSGKVSPFYETTGQNYFVKTVFSKGDIVGDTAVLADLQVYSASIIALTNCKILQLSAVDYINWIYNDDLLLKERTKSIITTLLHELRKKRTLEGMDNEIRILHFLLSYSKTTEHFLSKKIVIKKTRQQIADEIGGISVKTINRKLLSFSKSGIISLVKGKIHLSHSQIIQIEQIISLEYSKE